MERLLVAGSSVFTIRENAGPAEETLRVTISRDDRVEWTYQMASWRPLAVGLGCGSAYLWTARDLVVLPEDPGEDPVTLRVDEDLLVVFRTAAGWVLVCETSVRLVACREEISRIELADTVRAGLVGRRRAADRGCPRDDGGDQRHRRRPGCRDARSVATVAITTQATLLRRPYQLGDFTELDASGARCPRITAQSLQETRS